MLWAKGAVALRDPMVRNSVAIMVTTGVTSLLGYVFWIVVSRGSGAEAAGTGAAVTSAMQVAVLLASVGGPNALLARLPTVTSAAEWREKVSAIAVISVLLALVGGIVTVGVLGASVLAELHTVRGAVAFVALCAAISLSLVIDAALVCEYRTVTLVIKNTLMSGLRIPLYLVLVQHYSPSDSVLISWGLAAVMSFPVVLAHFRGDGRVLWPRLRRLRAHAADMRAEFAGQHLITVAAQVATFLLPIIVVGRLSPAENAYFYAAWMLCGVFFIVSPAVASALFVETAAGSADIAALSARSVRTIMAVLALPILFYLLFGSVLLSLFGADYATQGRTLLIILTLSAIPDALANVAVSVLRVTGRMGTALVLNCVILAACLIGAWVLLPVWGIAGAGIAWLVGQSGGALWVIWRWQHIVRPSGRHRRTGVATRDESSEIATRVQG